MVDYRIIVFPIIYLMFFGVTVTYFTQSMEMDNFVAPDLIGTTVYTHTQFKFDSTCNIDDIIIKDGNWICKDYGLESIGDGRNTFHLHPFSILAQREEDKVYRFAIDINNTAQNEFIVIIAKEYGPLPFVEDTIGLHVTDIGTGLGRRDRVIGIYDDWNYYDVDNTVTSTQTEFSMSLQWDVNTGDISAFDNVSGMFLEYSGEKGQTFNSGGDLYLGGMETEDTGIVVKYILEDTATTKHSALEKNDFIGFFLDMLGILGYGVDEEILPLTLQIIFLRIPEVILIVGISLMTAELITEALPL